MPACPSWGEGHISVRFVKKAVGVEAGMGCGLGAVPQNFFDFFISKYCILVHFLILNLKFYLQSNAGKGTV